LAHVDLLPNRDEFRVILWERAGIEKLTAYIIGQIENRAANYFAPANSML